ncbi:MAG: hypothetical protein WBO36_03950, partial [Saprospiraceae bacterium]
LLKSVDHYETEILLTLAFVMGGYTLCNYFHLSGALSMVVMGLMVGNFKKDIAMSDITQEYLQKLLGAGGCSAECNFIYSDCIGHHSH